MPTLARAPYRISIKPKAKKGIFSFRKKIQPNIPRIHFVWFWDEDRSVWGGWGEKGGITNDGKWAWGAATGTPHTFTLSFITMEMTTTMTMTMMIMMVVMPIGLLWGSDYAFVDYVDGDGDNFGVNPILLREDVVLPWLTGGHGLTPGELYRGIHLGSTLGVRSGIHSGVHCHNATSHMVLDLRDTS